MKELLDIDITALLTVISETFHGIIKEIKERKMKIDQSKKNSNTEENGKQTQAKIENVPAWRMQWKLLHAATISWLKDKTVSVSPLEKWLREHSKDKIADLISKLMTDLKNTFGADSELDRFIKRVAHEIVDAVDFLAKVSSVL